MAGRCSFRRFLIEVDHHVNERKKSDKKTQAEVQREIFEGLKGHQPKSDQELNEWLATDEGKNATTLKTTEFSFWGDRARS